MSMQQMTQPASSQAGIERAQQQAQVVRRLHTNNTIAIGVLWAITVIVTVLFIAIIVYLLIQGAPALLSLGFYGTGASGIAAELFNTFYILILTEVILFPISLGAAIYLIEYAHQGQLVTIIHFAAETLAGVPSIVLGLFGFAAFAVYGGFGISRLAGALTLLCLNFPHALRLFEAALATFVKAAWRWVPASGMQFAPSSCLLHYLALSPALFLLPVRSPARRLRCSLRWVCSTRPMSLR